MTAHLRTRHLTPATHLPHSPHSPLHHATPSPRHQSPGRRPRLRRKGRMPRQGKTGQDRHEDRAGLVPQVAAALTRPSGSGHAEGGVLGAASNEKTPLYCPLVGGGHGRCGKGGAGRVAGRAATEATEHGVAGRRGRVALRCVVRRPCPGTRAWCDRTATTDGQPVWPGRPKDTDDRPAISTGDSTDRRRWTGRTGGSGPRDPVHAASPLDGTGGYIGLLKTDTRPLPLAAAARSTKWHCASANRRTRDDVHASWCSSQGGSADGSAMRPQSPVRRSPPACVWLYVPAGPVGRSDCPASVGQWHGPWVRRAEGGAWSRARSQNDPVRSSRTTGRTDGRTDGRSRGGWLLHVRSIWASSGNKPDSNRTVTGQ